MAAKAGCLGQVMLGGSSGAMMPPFGAEKKLGTNPVAWSAPAGAETPFRLDVATTQVAANKIQLARRKSPRYRWHLGCILLKMPAISLWTGMGIKLYPSMIADDDGTPITEEVQAPSGNQSQGVNLLPSGGTRENGSHKGFGLGMVADLWACGLGVVPEDTAGADGRLNNGDGFAGGMFAFFSAWDISKFTVRTWTFVFLGCAVAPPVCAQ